VIHTSETNRARRLLVVSIKTSFGLRRKFGATATAEFNYLTRLRWSWSM